MNLQKRKKQSEDLLKKEKSELRQNDLDPFAIEELNELIDKAEIDSLMNNVKSTDELRKEIRKWS